MGYFDGDGFVTWSRSGSYIYPRWGLLGTERFLSGAMRLISEETAVAPRRVQPKDGSRIYRLAISGADALVVDRWIRSGLSLGLERKRLAQADIAAGSSSGK